MVKVYKYKIMMVNWHDAIAQPDELVINVGDMLSRHSNNRLKSTIHRVVNPPKESMGNFTLFYSIFHASY